MKKTVKQYAYYKLGKMKPQTVQGYINGKFPMFIEYCSINGIYSFADVTLEDYLNFNLWMKDEKKVATGTGFSTCHAVEEIIRIGQIKDGMYHSSIFQRQRQLTSYGIRKSL